MERRKEPLKVKWLFCSLWVMSFMREIFKAYGISCGGDIILLAEDPFMEKLIREEYVRVSKGNGIKVDLKTSKNETFLNCCLGIALLSDTDKQETINSFFEIEDFLPILVTGRVLAQEFREGYYVFKVKESDVTYLSEGDFLEHVTELKDFIITNIDYISQSLKMIDSSVDMIHVQKVRHKNLFKVFLAVSEIYYLFYRMQYGEEVALSFKRGYVATSLRMIQKISDFSEGIDVSEMLAETVYGRVDARKIKVICSIDEIERTFLQLFECGNAVFYDEEYYYFDERGLRKICMPLLEQMSWLELKHLMAEKNLIERVDSGFTSKKVFVIDGVKERVRVMKVHKEALISSNRIDMLEDYILNKEETSYE